MTSTSVRHYGVKQFKMRMNANTRNFCIMTRIKVYTNSRVWDFRGGRESRDVSKQHSRRPPLAIDRRHNRQTLGRCLDNMVYIYTFRTNPKSSSSFSNISPLRWNILNFNVQLMFNEYKGTPVFPRVRPVSVPIVLSNVLLLFQAQTDNKVICWPRKWAVE